MSSDTTYERELTRAEIARRKDDCFDLLTERDGLIDAVNERKREIKTLSLEQASLDARISVLRHEVRSGKILVTRQQVLPLDGPVLGDVNGNPVADPRVYHSRSHSDVFVADEPEPLSPFDLRQLVVALLPDIAPRLKVTDVESWHADVREDVQRWCRIEHAYAHPIAGMPLPWREPKPNVLEDLEHQDKPKRKARAKKAKDA
jgi:hypothetical protein